VASDEFGGKEQRSYAGPTSRWLSVSVRDFHQTTVVVGAHDRPPFLFSSRHLPLVAFVTFQDGLTRSSARRCAAPCRTWHAACVCRRAIR
jgi:hypothetical protein